MNDFLVEATARTPYIKCDAEAGKIYIEGRSIPKDADAFWQPIIEWFYAYSSAPNKVTVITFNFEYFNITTSKKIQFILHKLNELHTNNFQVEVEWEYSNQNSEMKEAGLDFSSIVDVPFIFKPLVC